MSRLRQLPLWFSLVLIASAAAPAAAQLGGLLDELLGKDEGEIEKVERVGSADDEVRYRVRYRELSSAEGVVLTARLLDRSLRRLSGFEVDEVEIGDTEGEAELSIRFRGEGSVLTALLEVRLERDGDRLAKKLTPLIRRWSDQGGGGSPLGALEETGGGSGPSGSEGSIVADETQIVEVTLDPVPLGDTAEAGAGGGSGGGGSGGGGSGGGGSGGGNGGVIIAPPPPVISRPPPDFQPLGRTTLGYAWGNSPSTASYAPSASYYYSTGNGPGRIRRAGVGNYQLELGGLGGSGGKGGNVQVTGYGPGAGRCQVQGWAKMASGLTAMIRCSDHGGRPQDARFSALALWSPGAGKSGYVWANNPTSASYTPPGTYAYNSAGGAVSVARSGVGVYKVTFAGLGDRSQGGNVQVTSYGSAGEYCKVASWSSGGADFAANVRCFNASGRPADSRFSALVISVAGRSTPTAYAWVDNATAASSQPSASYLYNSAGGGASVRHSGRGKYAVSFPELGGTRGGNVQVTAYGSGSETCKVVGWGAGATSFSANVSCWSPSGQPADTRFSILVLR